MEQAGLTNKQNPQEMGSRKVNIKLRQLSRYKIAHLSDIVRKSAVCVCNFATILPL